MSVLIPTTTEMRRPGGSRSRAALINSGPASAGSLFLPIPVHDPRTLAQRDLRLWPSPDGSPIRCHCGLEVVDASDVLDNIHPHHPKDRRGMRSESSSSRRCPESNGCREDATTGWNRTRTQDGNDSRPDRVLIGPEEQKEVPMWLKTSLIALGMASALAAAAGRRRS
jgi:hypothetical protein